MSVERRAVNRRKEFVFGGVQHPDGRELLCAVRDRSSLGARIEVEDVSLFPDEFKLRIDGEAEPMSCRVIWRFGTRIGVRFVLGPPVLVA